MRLHSSGAAPRQVDNIVPILKKNRKIRICIDFRDLNTACPKDEFSLPITNVMIDNTTAIASGNVGRDQQRGTSYESFL